MKILKDSKKIDLKEKKELSSIVEEIIDDVRNRGDMALIHYNKKFENNNRRVLRISKREIEEAYKEIDKSLMEALLISHKNIKTFAKAQKETIKELDEKEIMPGVFAGHRVIPIESCCCYVPGGGYPLFSTALMLATPAKVAGVKRVVACSPTMKGSNKINPATLVAMDIAGVDEIYAVGGAQGIAAFAYGTDEITPVDIIVGPGNQYVTEAKRQCFGQVGIDFIAGPSEVLIIGDEKANPEIIAADLLAQSEHDLQARGILITTSEDLGRKTLDEVEKQLLNLSTKDIATESWNNNGEIIVVETIDEACNLSNHYAPEHLELMVEKPEEIIGKLNNYGSLFIGELSAEVFGDYISGTNHALPTSRACRYTGGIWVGTFIKICTHQRITKEGIKAISGPTSIMAEAEGLYGHSHAVTIRNKLK